MTEDLKGKFYPTAIGSLPYRDPKVACEKIFGNFKEIPFWPQLIRRSFFENMYVQFSQGFPGAVVDAENKRIYINTQKDLSKEIEIVYDKFLKDDVDSFSIGREYAEGFYAFMELLTKTGNRPKFLKGHITGPVSFGLTVTDDKKRSLFYNTELKEVLIKLLSMRVRWQIRKLKETGINCTIFIDEPYLTSVGSSYVSLKSQEAVSALGEVIQAVHKEKSLCGIHCCGNTDWSLLLTTDVDILSFDAYNFYESISLYPKQLEAFFKRGGILAWGIIPNNRELLGENCDSLIKRFERAIELLVEKGIKKQDILSSMMITPSCGLGLIDEELSDKVIEHTAGFSERLRKLYK